LAKLIYISKHYITLVRKSGRARAEEASDVGSIMKLGIDRLGQRHFELNLDCPNCGSARIKIVGGNGHLDDISCPKCGIRIILDALNITIVNEAAGHKDAPSLEDPSRKCGSIL
jgi:hypothetical protein